MKKISQAIVLASAMTAGLAAVNTAQAEVSASAAIASEYLWRGQNLGSGTPQVSGSLDYAHDSGLYAGTWIGSGDTSYGSEYDLFAGYAPTFGEVGLDVGYATYMYAENPEADNLDDSAEVYLGLSYGMASVYVYKDSSFTVAGQYTVASFDLSDYAPLSIAVGNYGGTEGQGNYTHVDLTYSYNDKLAFTLSDIVDQDVDYQDGGYPDSPKLVLSYTLPIEM